MPECRHICLLRVLKEDVNIVFVMMLNESLFVCWCCSDGESDGNETADDEMEERLETKVGQRPRPCVAHVSISFLTHWLTVCFTHVHCMLCVGSQ